MTLDELPDDFTEKDFMQLDKESLDQVLFVRKKWLCQCKGCTNGTYIRDYSLSPFFFLDRNSKRSVTHTSDYWVNLSKRYLLCRKHYVWFARLSVLYGEKATKEKLLEKISPIQKIVSVK